MVTIWCPLHGRYTSNISRSLMCILPSMSCRVARPIVQYIQLRGRKSAIAAHPDVPGRRHDMGTCGGTDCQSKAAPFGFRLFVPFRQVHECAAPRDVVVNLRGKRRNAGVPGPDRVFGMTVLTCARENRTHRCRHLRARQQRFPIRGSALGTDRACTCYRQPDREDNKQCKETVSGKGGARGAHGDMTPRVIRRLYRNCQKIRKNAADPEGIAHKSKN